MLRLYSHISFVLGWGLQNTIEVCRSDQIVEHFLHSFVDRLFSRRKPDGIPRNAENLRGQLIQIYAMADELGLNTVRAQIDRFGRKSEPWKPVELEHYLEELRNKFQDELDNRWFLYVPPNLATLYRDRDLFGPHVASKFPDWSEDVENAGKCLAVGQGTAAVFHLMRVMEGAVGELATKLSIPKPDREWGKLLSDIHQAIENLPNISQADKELRNKWSESHNNLYHVKQAWRNPTMHPKETYTSEQAKEVFDGVRVFMSQLATLV